MSGEVAATCGDITQTTRDTRHDIGTDLFTQTTAVLVHPGHSDVPDDHNE